MIGKLADNSILRINYIDSKFEPIKLQVITLLFPPAAYGTAFILFVTMFLQLVHSTAGIAFILIFLTLKTDALDAGEAISHAAGFTFNLFDGVNLQDGISANPTSDLDYTTGGGVP